MASNAEYVPDARRERTTADRAAVADGESSSATSASLLVATCIATVLLLWRDELCSSECLTAPLMSRDAT